MGDLHDLLAVWMPRQRWYGTKGRDPQLTLVADWPLDDADARLAKIQQQVPQTERSPADDSDIYNATAVPADMMTNADDRAQAEAT